MKTEPTDIDREAARLFNVAQGMRCLRRCFVIVKPAAHGRAECVESQPSWTVAVNVQGDRWGFAIESGAKVGRRAESLESSPPMHNVLALDTDDPATVGCMLAQVSAVQAAFVSPFVGGGYRVELRLDSRSFDADSLGAALVAAMRAIKAKKEKDR